MYALTPEMEKRLNMHFTYHSPTPDQIPRYEEIRNLAHYFALRLVTLTPPGREQALALTALEDCVMQANKSIAVGEAH